MGEELLGEHAADIAAAARRKYNAGGKLETLTFLVSEPGRSFAVSALGNWFRVKCDQAGLPQCSA
jgi:hypothetical protein